jgi:hypothetical protein
VLARFHRRVQVDLDEILASYFAVSERLGNDFFAEFQIGVQRACATPRGFHFDSSGLRRCNLERFPYHFLYDLKEKHRRVWVVRHNRRDPQFGLGRYPRRER